MYTEDSVEPKTDMTFDFTEEGEGGEGEEGGRRRRRRQTNTKSSHK